MSYQVAIMPHFQKLGVNFQAIPSLGYYLELASYTLKKQLWAFQRSYKNQKLLEKSVK